MTFSSGWVGLVPVIFFTPDPRMRARNYFSVPLIDRQGGTAIIPTRIVSSIQKMTKTVFLFPRLPTVKVKK